MVIGALEEPIIGEASEVSTVPICLFISRLMDSEFVGI